MKDFEDLIQTDEQTLEELAALERTLAQRLGVAVADVRQVIIQKTLDNSLDEDEVVSQWHSAYSSYLEILRYRGAEP
jgi:hypothetical protein